MSAIASRSESLSRLREHLAVVEGANRLSALGFSVAALDHRLADGGLHAAAVHEFAPAAASLGDDAAATLFIAGAAARFAAAADARVLWVVGRFDLYAPGLEQAGLTPAKVLFAEGRDDKEVLALMEDALRHGGLAAVVGEVRRADMIATRRLQLAAEGGRTPVLLLRRWRRRGVSPLSELSAATTRWRIACAAPRQLR
ncbi:protein ImuA (plasmid) [Polymorphobacter sp. PAMC 29334]|uniref:ImuA family protein n=1 Tax=Polymorphobacter sp. PAMC 29334 TaxID=2862331 RepID=UPI001C7646EA|nr:protein ImuA [Polymorphobacter sp. PAMC 29334]